LLLDYEYSESITLSAHASNKYSEQQESLNDLVTAPSLPKILLSMKLERHIPSTLLSQYDGFLTKPLDASLLLSELLRLTLFARKTLDILVKHQYDSSLSFVEEDLPKKEILSPLILVVEDSPTNQKIACKMLSKLGYRSIVAEDGQQALEKLKSQREEISLILMDCRMPVMDGLQATQVIRSQGDKIPIVALTANNTEEDREACMQVGMDEFLSKPISKKDLESVLQSFIQ
jgi:CheY-like chemotaxis protein